MANRFTIKTILSILGLSEGDNYMVYMGGSLCMRKVRETKDLDICVEPDAFMELARRYDKEDEITISLGDRTFDLFIEGTVVEVFEREDFMNEAELVDGVWCQTLDEIIKMKRRFDRPKDKKDLELLCNIEK